VQIRMSILVSAVILAALPAPPAAAEDITTPEPAGKILYVHNQRQMPVVYSGLFLEAPDGSARHRIFRAYGRIGAASPSPNGRRFVVSWGVPGSPMQLSVINPRRGSALPVGIGNEPAWSPDGERIAFDRDCRLYVMDRNGTHERALTDGSPCAIQPAWSPDGSTIAFFRVPTDPPTTPGGVYLIDADGTDVRSVPGATGSSPAWSPDGQTIAFDGWIDWGNQDDLYACRYGQPVVMTIPVTGGEAQIVQGTKEGSGAHWSPDGSALAFTYFWEEAVESCDIWGSLDVATVPLTSGAVSYVHVPARHDETVQAWLP
jgi:dipeptidyl aminopeptidase/acylaminoacyl peptidase